MFFQEKRLGMLLRIFLFLLIDSCSKPINDCRVVQKLREFALRFEVKSPLEKISWFLLICRIFMYFGAVPGGQNGRFANRYFGGFGRCGFE